ncbi:MAG: response regulator [Acidobacteriota bacterium]
MLPHKILIVEDSPLHQKVYDLILGLYRRRGVVLLHASNGREGLAVLAANPDADLIILDINMPVMSGLEFLGHIRRERAFESIPVIICSTEGKDDDIRRGLRMGARGYIKKPFTHGELLDLIDRV